MEDYDRTMELVDAAYDSTGKSEEQFAKSSDTVDYKLKKLKNSWEQLRTSFLNSSTYKSILDMLNNVLGQLGNVSKKSLVAIGVIGLTIGKSIIKNIITSIQEASSSVQTAGQTLAQSFAKGVETNLSKKSGFFSKFFSASMTADYSKESLAAYKTELTKVSGINSQLNSTQLRALANWNNQLLKVKELEAMLEEGKIDETQITIELEKQRAIKEALRVEAEAAGVDRKDRLAAVAVDKDKIPKKQQYSVSSISGQITTSTISTAVTTAIVMGLSGSDAITAIKNAGIMAATTVLPQIIDVAMRSEKAIKMFEAVGTKAAGLLTNPYVLAIAVILASLAAVYLWQKHVNKMQENVKKAELDRLNAVEDKNEELEKSTASAQSKISSAYSNYEKFEKDYNRYEYLYNKDYKTSAEKTELTSLFEDITGNEDYEDLILAYDEEKEKITFVNDALGEFKENLEDIVETNLKTIKTNTVAENSNYEFVQTKNTKTKNEVASLEDMSDAGFATADALFTIMDEEIDTDTIERVSKSLYGVSDAFTAILSQAVVTEDELNKLNEKYKENVSIDDLYDQLNEELQSNIDNAEDEQVKAVKENMAQLYQAEFIDEDTGEAISEELANALVAGIDSDQLANSVAQVSTSVEDIITDTSVNRFELLRNMGSWRGFDEDWMRDNYKALGLMSEEAATQFYEDIEGVVDSFGLDDEGWDKAIFGSGTNFKTMESYTGADDNTVEKAFGDFLENSGMTDEYWNSIRKDSVEAGSYYLDFLNQQVLTTEGILEDGFDITSDFYQEHKGYFSKLSSFLSDTQSNLTEEEYEKIYTGYINQLSEEGTEGTVRGNLEAALAAEQASYNSTVEALQESYFGTNTDLFDSGKLTKGMVSALDTLLSTTLADYDLTERQGVANVIANTFDSLSSDYGLKGNQLANVEGVLTNIDLTQDESTLYANKQNYISQIKKLNIDEVSAQKIINDYLDQASDELDELPTTAESVKSSCETIATALSTIASNFENTFSAISNYLSNGIITVEDYSQLIEDGMEQYVTEGFGLDLTGIMQDYMDQAQDQVDLAISDQQETFDLATKWKDEEDQNNIQEAIKTAAIEAIDKDAENTYTTEDLQNKDLKDILSLYSENIDDDAKFSGLAESLDLDNYTEAQKKAIIQTYSSISAGEEMEDKFIEIANAYDSEITNLRNVQLAMVLEEYKEIYDAKEELEKNLRDQRQTVESNKRQITAQEVTIDRNWDKYQDALEEQYEAYHGSWDYDSGIDAMSDFTNTIKDATDKVSDLTDALEETTTIEEAKTNLTELNNALTEEQNTAYAGLTAAKQVVADKKSEISNDDTLSQWITFDSNGNAQIDMGFENTDLEDAYKDWIKESYNDLVDAESDVDTFQENYDDAVDKRKEVYDDIYKDITDEEDEIADILKEKYEEQIEDKEDYYDALKEADDDYIEALRDAIDKQRELRDQEDKYEDLATKEKKLSLMSRDTSGANQKEIQELEEEVEDDRQELLDDKIDTLIDSLEEMYEDEQEAREAEIEALNANTEAINWNAQASELISSWGGDADARAAWYLANDSEAENLTPEQTVSYLNELESGQSAIVNYQALTETGFKEAIETDTTYMSSEVSEVTEYYKTKLDEMKKKADETAEDTKKSADEAAYDTKIAWEDAKISLDNLKTSTTDAEKELVKLQSQYDLTWDSMEEATDQTLANIVALAEADGNTISQTCIKQIQAITGWSEEEITAWISNHKTDIDKAKMTNENQDYIEKDENGNVKTWSTQAQASQSAGSYAMSGNYTNVSTIQNDDGTYSVIGTKKTGGSASTTTDSSTTSTTTDSSTTSTTTDSSTTSEVSNIVKNHKLPSTSTKDEEGNAYNIKIETEDGQFYYGNNLLTMETQLYNNNKKPYARWYLSTAGVGYKKDGKLYVYDLDKGDDVPLTWEYLDTHMGNAFTGKSYLDISPVDHYYKQGGLVDYTGIAQVDGTPSKPEAFLNAEQTEALKQLASNFTNYSSLLNTVQDFYNNYGEQVETNTQLTNNTSNVGDTSVEVHINIENISSDVDVDEALDKMENRLAEVYNYAGSSVILSK